MKEFFYILIIDRRTDPPSEHFYVKHHALVSIQDIQSQFTNAGIRNLKTFKAWFATMNFKLEKFDSAPLYAEENTLHFLVRVAIDKGDKIQIHQLEWKAIEGK